jgi:amidase
MSVKRPTLEQMSDIVESLGMTMTKERVGEFLSLMEGNFAAYDLVDQMPDEVPVVKYPRTPGYRPSPEENPHNAWYVKTDIQGAPKGKLKGKTVAVKDNVCVAGVPMMNGSSTLEGYIPNIDATVVTRLLDAGAVIKGKAHCECFCLSGGSHTGALGHVHNPHKRGYSAGGSSSGSGALVAAGEVDLAIGGDQGGSIRMPASFCGVYGMKPTHGLVPYTGVMPIESTIDHTGPITATVADNALMLEVLAGADGLDPRQYAPKIGDYSAAAKRGAKGLKIGVVKEGFGHANSEKDVDASVREAAKRFTSLGAKVDEVSIPEHLIAPAIWTPIALEGLQAQMMLGNGMGFNWKGLYTVSLLDAHANWRQMADGRPVFPDPLSRALLREGAKSGAQGPRLLRQSARVVRSPADANPPSESHGAAPGRCTARTLPPACVRDDRQYCAFQRHGPSRNERPLRPWGRIANRRHADWQAFR